MKKVLSLILVLVLVMALFAGCGGDTGEGDNTTTGNNTSNADDISADSGNDSSDEVFTLTFSYFAPENIAPSTCSLEAFDMATERSGGRLQFDCYFSGTLLSTEDVVSGCQMGTADIVMAEGTQLGEVFELNNIFCMGYTSAPPSRAATTEVYRQLIKDCPEIQEELASQGLTWLSLFALGGYHIHA